MKEESLPSKELKSITIMARALTWGMTKVRSTLSQSMSELSSCCIGQLRPRDLAKLLTP